MKKRNAMLTVLKVNASKVSVIVSTGLQEKAVNLFSALNYATLEVHAQRMANALASKDIQETHAKITT